MNRAVEEGATLALGGQRSGAFFPPAVLTDVQRDGSAYTEEFFGPVAQVFRALARRRDVFDVGADNMIGPHDRTGSGTMAKTAPKRSGSAVASSGMYPAGAPEVSDATSASTSVR